MALVLLTAISLFSTAHAQVRLRASVTQLADGLCFCWGSKTRILESSDLPFTLRECGGDLELLSFNPNTNILRVDGDGGRATVNIAQENYVYTKRGWCMNQLHVTIEGRDPHGYNEDLAYEAISTLEIVQLQNNPVPGLTNRGYSNVSVFNDQPPAILGMQTEVRAVSAVNHGDKQILAAFRGSNNVEQVVVQILEGVTLDDWEFGSNFCTNCDPEIVSYFGNAGNGLLDAGLRNKLSSLRSQYPNYDLLFAGLSLGGAVANIAALELRLEGVIGNDVQVYTAGQPRVGEGDFVDNYNRLVPNTYRVVFNRDIVPRYPFCHNNCRDSGPNHVGIEAWYLDARLENESLCGHVVCRERESLNCARSLSNRVSINDHTDGYIQRTRNGFCDAGPP